jgi:hypothetical protein
MMRRLTEHQHLFLQGQGTRVFATFEHGHRTDVERKGVGRVRKGWSMSTGGELREDISVQIENRSDSGIDERHKKK